MNNTDIEAKGLDIVIAHELKYGRNAERVQRCGYDLCSRGNGSERHIEVKATKKSQFPFRWLEKLEQKCAETDPNFYLYLVTDVDSPNPRIIEYDYQKLKKCFSHIESHYVYKFPISDFQKREKFLTNSATATKVICGNF
jgi:hypothetical protein